MFRNALKTGLVVMILGLVVQDANAFGHRGCGGGGYGGFGGCGYGGYGGYAGYGYGGYGYGGYGGYGYGNGAYGCGVGGYPGNGCGGYIRNPTNGRSSPAAPFDATSSSTSQPTSDSARLTISVPAEGKVFINGLLTKSTGEHRNYSSSGLRPAAVYPYHVRVEFVRDGKSVIEEKSVQLTAGQTASLAFSVAPDAKMADMAKSAQR